MFVFESDAFWITCLSVPSLKTKRQILHSKGPFLLSSLSEQKSDPLCKYPLAHLLKCTLNCIQLALSEGFFPLSGPIEISEKSNLARTALPFSRMPAKWVLRRMASGREECLILYLGPDTIGKLPGGQLLLTDSTFPFLTGEIAAVSKELIFKSHQETPGQAASLNSICHVWVVLKKKKKCEFYNRFASQRRICCFPALC